MSLNVIAIAGRLTRDPELRRTPSGDAVCSFSVAVDRNFSKEKEADFFDCVAWRGTAEFVSKWFTKGRMIIVNGRMQSRKWQDKNGQNRISWEIQADNVSFAGDKQSENTGDGYTANGYSAGYSGGYPAGRGVAVEYESGNDSRNAPGYGGYGAGYGASAQPANFAEAGEDDGDLPF